jgi:hypothetical protein
MVAKVIDIQVIKNWCLGEQGNVTGAAAHGGRRWRDSEQNVEDDEDEELLSDGDGCR